MSVALVSHRYCSRHASYPITGLHARRNEARCYDVLSIAFRAMSDSVDYFRSPCLLSEGFRNASLQARHTLIPPPKGSVRHCVQMACILWRARIFHKGSGRRWIQGLNDKELALRFGSPFGSAGCSALR